MDLEGFPTEDTGDILHPVVDFENEDVDAETIKFLNDFDIKNLGTRTPKPLPQPFVKNNAGRWILISILIFSSLIILLGFLLWRRSERKKLTEEKTNQLKNVQGNMASQDQMMIELGPPPPYDKLRLPTAPEMLSASRSKEKSQK